MLKFVFKNLLTKLFQTILIFLSIVLSCGVAVLSYNTSNQISDGITSSAAYYSLIIGPSGSNTQLVMNTIYYIDKPVGTIPYELVSTLQQDNRVKSAIPFAIADSYKGYNLVGSTKDLISDLEMKKGEMFAIPNNETEQYEVVLGHTVAVTTGLKIGDVFYTSHSVGHEHHTPFIVKGILNETHSAKDIVIYTHLKSIWYVHEEHEDEEEHEHEYELDNMVCAIIVNTTNPTTATVLANEFNNSIFTDHSSDSYSLQAVEPMAVVRSVLNDVNTTKNLVYILSGVVLVMNIMIIAVITLLNMYHTVEEISLMRLIGISMPKINLVYLIQNSFIGLISTIISFFTSRIALTFMSDYVRSTGAVLNLSKVYPLEIVILVVVFLITITPTIVSTFILSKKSGMRS